MTAFDKLLLQLEAKLSKALSHLKYTYKKVITLPDEYNELDEEQLVKGTGPSL